MYWNLRGVEVVKGVETAAEVRNKRGNEQNVAKIFSRRIRKKGFWKFWNFENFPELFMLEYEKIVLTA